VFSFSLGSETGELSARSSDDMVGKRRIKLVKEPEALVYVERR